MKNMNELMRAVEGVAEEEAEILERLERVQQDPAFAVNTIDRLRKERSRLRNEVVELRGQQPHDYEPDFDPERLGMTMQFRCGTCGKVTSTPTHAYFDPCAGQ